MNPIRIGVTGVGGGAGQSILKALNDSGYELVGLDGETLGTGLYATPIAYKIPYASSKEFIPVLLDICAKERVALLFPGLDAELGPLSKHQQEFAVVGTQVIVSDPSVVEISDNKLVTFQKLTGLGFQVPKTMMLEDYLKSRESIPFPLIVKQHIGGARSKNVFVFRIVDELNTFLTGRSDLEKFIAQEYIDGEEYTCGSVTVGGECKGVIVMRAVLRDGDTYKCFVENNPLISQTVFSLLKAIKPFGACNVQLRMKGNTPYVFEINARCSGTTAARALCGFNEPKAIADYLLKGIEPVLSSRNQTVLRYWNELVVENDAIEQMKSTGHLLNQNSQTL